MKNDERHCNRDSFVVLNGENCTVDDFLLPPEFLQVQVLEDFENDFIQWKRGDFGLNICHVMMISTTRSQDIDFV